MKTDQEEKVKLMLREAKVFVSNFDELISKISEDEIKSYREIMQKASVN